MADPKSCGPDPYRLLEAADNALTVCELVLPKAPSVAKLQEAASAIEKARPHLERRIADELANRLQRFEVIG